MRWTKSFLEIDETIITLLTNPGGFCDVAEDRIHRERNILKSYIREYPDFRTTHTAWIHVAEHEIIQKMIASTEIFHIGPMAAVAGAISETVLEAVIEAGAKEVVVDNGGDIALYIHDPVYIG
ncbi:UPF0280 family protein, partial [bacterium]|nr:UPF0280 family protein [candidate division CSSED10-310 bacterium]